MFLPNEHLTTLQAYLAREQCINKCSIISLALQNLHFSPPLFYKLSLVKIQFLNINHGNPFNGILITHTLVKGHFTYNVFGMVYRELIEKLLDLGKFHLKLSPSLVKTTPVKILLVLSEQVNKFPGNVLLNLIAPQSTLKPTATKY